MRQKIISSLTSLKGQNILCEFRKNMLPSTPLLKGHAIAGERILKQNSQNPHSTPRSLTHSSRPIKHIAGKRISLICQQSRGSLWCWPLRGWEPVLLGAVNVDPDGRREDANLGTGADSQLALTKRHAQPPERPTAHRAPPGTAQHPGLT